MIANPEIAFVLQLPVHLLKDYTGWLVQRLQEKTGTHVITLNAEMAILADKNPAIAQAIREADLVIPDGAGIVLYLRFQGYRQQRCPGIELAESLLQQIGHFGETYPIAFYGSKPGVAEAAAQAWRRCIPDISIIANHGYLTPEEAEQWQQTLKIKQPKVILVGLGVPRQEFWIRENRHFCPEAIWIGVGGSLDIWSGSKARAPAWFCNNNLEWLYRLYQEPWRWKRMLALPHFFWQALLKKSIN